MHVNTTGGETGVTKREAQILTILRKNPTISHKELAERLGITRSAASVHLTNLAKRGRSSAGATSSNSPTTPWSSAAPIWTSTASPPAP